MKAQTYCRDKAFSELAMLSRDPALAFRPDPAFRARFRNPDEINEGDFSGIRSLAGPYVAAARTWAGAASWRRSPKD
jgi:hypothetical protein